jgi:hypothetical protein
MPGFAFPAVGPLGLRSPRSRPPSPAPSVLRSAKTASALLGWLRLSLALRYFARLLCFVSRSRGSPSTWRLACGARALVPPVPLIFRLSWTKRQEALPSSRVTPVGACPALRPRWYPWCSPYRPRDCCLPPVAQRRLSPPSSAGRLSLRSTTIHISGFNFAAYSLATPGSGHPISGIARGFAADLLALL